MTDRRVVFTVTVLLGCIVLGGLGSIVALALAGEVVPDVVGLVTTAALGSLASLLVSTSVNPAQLPSPQPSAADPPSLPAPASYVEKRLATDEGNQPAPRRRTTKP